MTRILAALAALFFLLAIAPLRAEPAAPPVGKIDALLAPIALYPDALLMPLLMAATYPEEVVEAQAWLGEAENGRLRGDALVAALEPRPWDPSVKALLPFPETLGMMAGRPEWMGELGRAFVAAPVAVMAAIQKLRRAALATGKLKTSPHLLVRIAGPVIAIAPPDPAMVYIPVYNPALVFGPWPYPDYPPGFIEPPTGFRVSGADMATGIGFSVGFGVLRPLWGWARPDWGAGTVAIDTAAYQRIDRYGPHVAASTWHHEAPAAGYFHITQAQITPVRQVVRHGHERLAAHLIRVARRGGKGRARHLVVRLVHRGKGHARLLRAASRTRVPERRQIAQALPRRGGKLRMASAGRSHRR